MGHETLGEMDVIKPVALWFVQGCTVAVIELMAEIARVSLCVGCVDRGPEVLTGHSISTVFVVGPPSKTSRQTYSYVTNHGCESLG